MTITSNMEYPQASTPQGGIQTETEIDRGTLHSEHTLSYREA